jgi:hypothetical protein
LHPVIRQHTAKHKNKLHCSGHQATAKSREVNMPLYWPKTLSKLYKNILQKHTSILGKGMQSNTTVSIKVYLMAVLDNYMFRPLLAIFRLSSRELKVLLHTLSAHVVQRSLQKGLITECNFYMCWCAVTRGTVRSGG